MRKGQIVSYSLLLFAPAALWLDRMPQVSAPIVFFVSAAAIVPLARLITTSTEELAEHTGDAMGGLINAIFGNTPELIIALLALQAGLHELVAASIIGAILFNLLLVLGLCLLAGGLRQHILDFNARATSIYSSMMFIAVMSLALPSVYRQALSGGAASPHAEYINVVFALVLLALFGLYLLFMIRTHPEIFASVARAEQHETMRSWSVRRCVVTLLLASLLAALLSEVLVGTIEETGEKLGLSASFLGIVLLASVGGTAEGMSALSMARKGRMDLALGIALGSCILVALFIAPALVLTSYFVGEQPFQLTFNLAGVALLFLAVLIAAVVVSGGSGHWYKGVQLITVYLMIALLLYSLPR